jgi:predicted GTPase
LNPDAVICRSDLRIQIDNAERLVGQRVLVIEDGPTVTHGGMAFGAGMVAAERHGAIPVDPRPYAVGTIRDTFEANPHLERVLPAMGYSETQRESLASTINACCAAENVSCVLDASPARLDRMMHLDVPLVRVLYRFVQLDGPPLEERVMNLLK